jgi:hypothetical protein
MKHTYSLDFGFKSRQSGPTAWIYVKNFERRKSDGAPVIGDWCGTFKEVEWEVEHLKNELDIILAKARKKFGS